MREIPEADEAAIERILSHVGKRVVVGLPLGLGKPVGLVNALYRRVAGDPSLELEIVTALSLDVPTPGGDMQRRFLEPFSARHFGEDPRRLEYVGAIRRKEVPENIRIVEFYFRSGAALHNPIAQRHYISANYTHVARDLVDRGVNLVLQFVAAEDGAGEGEGRISLSCNPDVTLELAARMAEAGRKCHMVGRLHPDLPFMHGEAIVERDFFDEILPPPESPDPLFAIPRQPVSPQDYWVGLHASTLVEDGGTLQIGIGALSDALVHALIMRNGENAEYRRTLERAPNGPRRLAALTDPFEEGLYGASEMFMDGFMHLYRAGILKREVFDDETLQEHANAGRWDELGDRRGTGAVMDGAFFLGSRPFYEFLAGLDEEERPRFRMNSVESINQLYGGNEALEILQRRGARFFNTCMMVTATGAAVSDGLEDYQMVSGVGGQYNFVAMAHAMRDGRSVLMLRSTRGSDSSVASTVVWEHPHATIPRHLRDIVVTEYGIAELRGRTDEECIQALLRITDSRFQDDLADRAKEAGKLHRAWEIPDHARQNRPERLASELDADRFPSFPFGSDFTPVEERLVAGLKVLKRFSKSRSALARALVRGRPERYPEEMERMGLASPSGLKERASARLLAHALESVRRP